jgi:predicted secreted hydrolase
VYGTYVAPDGTVTHLPADAFNVTATGSWTSPHSGATYPAGWTIAIPSQQLSVTLTPTVADQELDTRATTGVIYWEGSQHVTASRSGQPLAGEAYVELTGYAGSPALAPSTGASASP